MKRLHLGLLATLACSLCHAQNEARLAFDIKGLGKTDTISLYWGAINKSMNLFITLMEQKRDKLTLPLIDTRLIVIGIKGMDGGYELIASPGESVEIAGHLHIDRMGKKPRAEFRKVRVAGARYQSAYSQILTDYIYHLDSLDTGIDQDFKGVKKIISWAKNNNDEQAIADMYQTREGQDYIDRVVSNFNDKNSFLEQLVYDYRDSFLGPMLMLRLGGRLTPSQYPLYESMSPEAQNSYYGREVRDEVAPTPLVGSLAPTVTVMSQEGEEKPLSLTGYGGKVLLIDFWASWCQPCIKEISNLRRLYDEFHDEGLEIIGISADRNIGDWEETLAELQLPWRNYIDLNQQATTEYAVKYIPTLFVVDTEGNIIAEKLRGLDLESFLLNRLGQ